MVFGIGGKKSKEKEDITRKTDIDLQKTEEVMPIIPEDWKQMYGRLSNMIGFGVPQGGFTSTDAVEPEAQTLDPTVMSPEEQAFLADFDFNQYGNADFGMSQYDMGAGAMTDGDMERVPMPKTKAEFDALPVGSLYRDDEGIKRKGNQQAMPNQTGAGGASPIGNVPDMSDYI
jgi:hypothetical protein